MNNYHTHTWRCKHAQGTVTDYAHAAYSAGIGILGMSDHTPLPDNRWSFIRMTMDELSPYLEEIKEAQIALPKLTILKALECDWALEYENYYRDELLGEKELDYLIGAVHWFPYRGEWIYSGNIENAKHLYAYSSHVIKAMESGLFSFMAHPDLFGTGYKNWDENARSCADDIISAAESIGVILEINGYGLRKPPIITPQGERQPYPLTSFWELAGQSNITAICNSDAHTPIDVDGALKEAEKIAENFSVNTAKELPVSSRQIFSRRIK